MGNNSSMTQKETSNTSSKQTEIPQIPGHIILMGDSVLDNFYWLNNKKNDTKKQLQDRYKKKVEITNLAVDESTSDDVLNGMKPNYTYVEERESNKMEPYPIDKNGRVEPLTILKNIVNDKHNNNKPGNSKLHTISRPIVVLAMGGNDVRTRLFFLSKGYKTVVDKLKQAGFPSNCEKIIKIICQDLKCHLILIGCYQPKQGFISPNKQMESMALTQLLKVVEYGFNDVLFPLAEKYKCPVIDLTHTFNPTNETHYGKTSIEPSELTTRYMVDLIQYICKYHNFDGLKDYQEPKSQIYFGYNDKNDKSSKIQVINNDKETRKGTFERLLQRNKDLGLILE